jgi:hypothetical protein
MLTALNVLLVIDSRSCTYKGFPLFLIIFYVCRFSVISHLVNLTNAMSLGKFTIVTQAKIMRGFAKIPDNMAGEIFLTVDLIILKKGRTEIVLNPKYESGLTISC